MNGDDTLPDGQFKVNQKTAFVCNKLVVIGESFHKLFVIQISQIVYGIVTHVPLEVCLLEILF